MIFIKNNLSKLAVFTVLTCTLSACKSTEQSPQSYQPDNSEIDKALMQSAAMIADSQRVIARSENAMRVLSMTPEQKQQYREAKEVVLPGMANPIPLYNDGELEQILRVLAQMTNYEFEVRAAERRPRGGIMVSISSNGRPAQVLVEELGNLAGELADVIVMPFGDEERKTDKLGLITLVYR